MVSEKSGGLDSNTRAHADENLARFLGGSSGSSSGSELQGGDEGSLMNGEGSGTGSSSACGLCGNVFSVIGSSASGRSASTASGSWSATAASVAVETSGITTDKFHDLK